MSNDMYAKHLQMLEPINNGVIIYTWQQ